MRRLIWAFAVRIWHKGSFFSHRALCHACSITNMLFSCRRPRKATIRHIGPANTQTGRRIRSICAGFLLSAYTILTRNKIYTMDGKNQDQTARMLTQVYVLVRRYILATAPSFFINHQFSGNISESGILFTETSVKGYLINSCFDIDNVISGLIN